MTASAETAELNARKLVEAFASFSQVSSSLEETFQTLQSRVRQLSRELEQTNDYLVGVLQSLPCGIVVVEESSRVTTMNQTAARLLGLRTLPLPRELQSLLSDPDRLPILSEALAGDSGASELSLEEGKTLTLSRSRMRGSGVVVVIQDVTRIRRLEEAMRRSEALAAMGEMAVEIAHEIRNPLAGLELFASLVGRPGLRREERRRYADNIRIGVRSLNNVVSNMLSFSKEWDLCPVPTRVDELLEEILCFMSPLLEQREIEVVRRFRSVCNVDLDRQVMGQAFTNLVSNALRALPRRGRLTLETEDEGGEVKVLIRDNGIGIPEPHRKRIFDPRFTTHPDGTGLGLAIVNRAVQAHGAEIRVVSREGRGAEFEIRLRSGGLS